MPRSAPHVCTLKDGRRVPFSVKSRKKAGRPNWFVRFRGPDGDRKELTTLESGKPRAIDAAPTIIQETYTPHAVPAVATWEAAEAVIIELTTAQNLRSSSTDDYLMMMRLVHDKFPDVKGPAAITLAMAEVYKAQRMTEVRTETVRTNIQKLRTIWGKWLKKLVPFNPWKDVEKPKADELVPRYIDPDEEKEFFAWLRKHWDNWRLPILFFEVKAVLGCRILQLCSVKTDDLRDGRIFLSSETAKGRVNRNPHLPESVYAELKAQAGQTWLWERYTSDLESIHRRKKLRGYVKVFSPKRLKRWLQNQIAIYNHENANTPGFQPFTAHDFRATAMSTAIDKGTSLDNAATNFACNAATIQKHYLTQDKRKIEDRTTELLFQSRQAQHQGQAENGTTERLA